MLKNLETGLAEREAMIRILQSNKTMSNSNLAAEIVNKAASGVVVGAPATSGISDTNSVDATSALRSMLLQTPSSLHTSGSHNLPQHQYQMSLVGSTTPSSSATSILHNKTLSHLAHDPHQSLRHASSPSFSSRALLLPSNPPPPPAPLPSVATSLSMISSAMGHSKQLSTPITLGSSNAFKSISLNSTPIRNLSAFPPTNQLPTHSFLNQIHNANHPTPSNPLLLGRSMTPSADMLLLRSSATPLGHNPTSADILRSMTPGPTDLHRPPAYTSIGGGEVANQLDQLTLKTAALRRESAPGGVFAANASTSHPMVSIGPNSGTK